MAAEYNKNHRRQGKHKTIQIVKFELAFSGLVVAFVPYPAESMHNVFVGKPCYSFHQCKEKKRIKQVGCKAHHLVNNQSQKEFVVQFNYFFSIFPNKHGNFRDLDDIRHVLFPKTTDVDNSCILATGVMIKLHAMLQRQVSLRSLNTFGFDISAMLFAEIAEIEQLNSIWKTNLLTQSSPLVLGGGSNIVFTGDYPGLILRNCFSGINISHQTAEHVYLTCGGGEPWHTVVMHAVQHNWGGLENMSLIPGTMGAAPIQNIGAYGAELKDVFESLRAFDMLAGKMISMHAKDCRFGYRDSIFKQEGKGRYFITEVTLRLSKNPVVNVKYGDIATTLDNWKINKPGIADVSRAVIHIRQSKLPDPAVLGNCGSFFKNPVISATQAAALTKQFPDAKCFEQPDGGVKIAAGWLIEEGGWKGFRRGDAGVHEKQALVLVNYGNATGKEIISLAREIVEDIRIKFGVELEMEVNSR